MVDAVREGLGHAGSTPATSTNLVTHRARSRDGVTHRSRRATKDEKSAGALRVRAPAAWVRAVTRHHAQWLAAQTSADALSEARLVAAPIHGTITIHFERHPERPDRPPSCAGNRRRKRRAGRSAARFMSWATARRGSPTKPSLQFHQQAAPPSICFTSASIVSPPPQTRATPTSSSRRCARRSAPPITPAVLATLSPCAKTQTNLTQNAPVRAGLRYLDNRTDQLNYACALALDLPVGSGLIKNGHRHVL